MKSKPTEKQVKKERKNNSQNQDKYINPNDDSTTRIARATSCCGGYHQTIAGALLKTKEWEDWYEHASKNMLFDVAETTELDAMSDEHMRAFLDFILQSQRQMMIKEVERLEENEWNEDKCKALQEVLNLLQK